MLVRNGCLNKQYAGVRPLEVIQSKVPSLNSMVNGYP